MHTVLSSRIAKLATNLSEPSSPKQLKSEIFDLAKDCQVLAEQKFLLRVTAHRMTPLVRRVFGPMAIIFPLTEPGRRHVYLAVLAKLDADNRLDTIDEVSRVALLERLLTLRNADLISEAYGTNPKGFLRLITRLGHVARDQDFYLDLYQLLTDAPSMAAPLVATIGKDALSNEMLARLKVLPTVPDSITLASKFSEHGRLETFLQAYQTLTGQEYISDAHLNRIKRGESPDRIIEDLYLSRPFAPAVIQGEKTMTHITNGRALIGVAKRFRNCLRNYVPEALKGERQYYIWHRPDTRDVVFEIQSDGLFGWFFSEARHEKNQSLLPEEHEELRELLYQKGILRCHSLERLMRPFLTQDDDQVDMLDWLEN